ncbi:MAG: hypothetical protein EZS28_036173 [Streblomastix strix]|uniref:Uncharacterized protein n=1 Tax=Streblomastix strix TaxID=222440 RepID=A0A5J4UEA5_9EUKA|nr:MAG: hypothetical protein EZS28_036173 [Streblomastix strix]
MLSADLIDKGDDGSHDKEIFAQMGQAVLQISQTQIHRVNHLKKNDDYINKQNIFPNDASKKNTRRKFFKHENEEEDNNERCYADDNSDARSVIEMSSDNE